MFDNIGVTSIMLDNIGLTVIKLDNIGLTLIKLDNIGLTVIMLDNNQRAICCQFGLIWTLFPSQSHIPSLCYFYPKELDVAALYQWLIRIVQTSQAASLAKLYFNSVAFTILAQGQNNESQLKGLFGGQILHLTFWEPEVCCGQGRRHNGKRQGFFLSFWRKYWQLLNSIGLQQHFQYVFNNCCKVMRNCAASSNIGSP